MAMELTRKQIGTNLFKNHKGIRTEWYLSSVYWLNRFSISFGRSNPSAYVECRPSIGEPFVLARADEGGMAAFDYEASDLWFAPPFLGDGSRIVLVVPKGSATAYVELEVELETREAKHARRAKEA